jgi:trehalose-6-phosphatase
MLMCVLVVSVCLHCQVLEVLQALTADPHNEVWVISGRAQQELGGWFESVVSQPLGLCSKQ